MTHASPHAATLAPPTTRTELRLTGPVAGVRLPDACARCGAAPAGTLPLRKMFRRTYSDAPTRYVFGALDVPYCAACLAQHARELAPVDPKVTRGLMIQYGLKLLPYVLPIGVLLFLLTKFVPVILRSIAEDGLFNWGGAIGAGVLAFLGVSLLSLVHLVREARQLLIGGIQTDPNDSYVRFVPTPVGGHFIIAGPPTSVLGAVDFTDDRSQLFDGEQHVFRFTDPVFAAQVAAANTGQLWDPTSPRARRNAGVRRLVLIGMVVGGGLFFLYDLFLS